MMPSVYLLLVPILVYYLLHTLTVPLECSFATVEVQSSDKREAPLLGRSHKFPISFIHEKSIRQGCLDPNLSSITSVSETFVKLHQTICGWGTQTFRFFVTSYPGKDFAGMIGIESFVNLFWVQNLLKVSASYSGLQLRK